MTKGMLLKLLEPFADNQHVCVLLYSDTFPAGSHTAAQDVVEFPPWHPRDDVPNLIGIVAHASNAEINCRALRAEMAPRLAAAEVTRRRMRELPLGDRS